MKVSAVEKDKFTLEMDQRELRLINNALNEICNGIDIPEFESRVGAPVDDARRLLEQIHALLVSGDPASGA